MWLASAPLEPADSQHGPLGSEGEARYNEGSGEGKITADPLTSKVAAVSCGIHQGTPVLDLDYIEDSGADADANFVLIEGGKIAEVQATAEGATYDEEGLLRLLRLAQIGCAQIFKAQDAATR